MRRAAPPAHPHPHPLPHHHASYFSHHPPIAEDDSPTLVLPPPPASSLKGHQRSRTTVELPPLFNRAPSVSPGLSSTFLPFLRHSRDRSVSPERVSPSEAAEFDVGPTPPLETPPELHRPHAGKVEKLASWFNGASDHVNITLVPSPTKDRADPVHSLSTMERLFSGSSETVDSFTRRPAKPSRLPSDSFQSVTGRFPFLRSSSSNLQTTPNIADGLADLDIRDALFPTGPVEDYSRASFKNLQLNAESLLRRFQDAHRHNQQAFKSLMKEQSAKADDLEAIQTRNEHLKLQLVEMAEKAAEQERTIAELKERLSVSQGNNLNSIRLVSHDSGSSTDDPRTPGRPPLHKNRFSDVSSSNDSECDSDVSSAVSVFSDAASGTYSPGTSLGRQSPVQKQAAQFYQPTLLLEECQKCHGASPSEAWDVVDMMKLESAALKERIEELEGAQGDVLNLLGDLKFESVKSEAGMGYVN